APAIENMARDVNNPRIQRLLETVHQDIDQGKSLEEAFTRHAGKLPPLFLSLLRAGEQTGNLPAALRQLTDYTQSLLRLKHRLQTALAYPALLLVFLMLFLGVFVVAIVPQYAGMYAAFGKSLPWATQTLLTISFLVLIVGYPLA